MYDKGFVLEFYKNLFAKIQKSDLKERDLKVNFIPEKCVTIIGPRRAGKTYYLLMHYKRNLRTSIYFDFEHSAFREVTHKDIFEIISLFEKEFDVKVKHIYLDEIQVLSKWESLVRSLLDDGYHVMISGSSSKFLSKEVATQLRGRTLTYLLLPLSFKEYLRFRGIKVKENLAISEKIAILKELEKFLNDGAFPEIVLREEDKEKILREYFSMTLYKDFVERHNISRPYLAKYIFEFCFQNYANELSVKKVVEYVQSRISKKVKDVIYEYMELIEDTLAVFFLEKASLTVSERLSWPKKTYVADLGLAKIVAFKKDMGKKMENAVFLELLRKQNTNPLQELYYYKTPQGYEVDFLIKEGNKIKELIQVTYANSYEEIEDREIRALLHAKKNLNLSDNTPLTVITWDYEDAREEKWFGMHGKIRFVPLWKWLLN